MCLSEENRQKNEISQLLANTDMSTSCCLTDLGDAAGATIAALGAKRTLINKGDCNISPRCCWSLLRPAFGLSACARVCACVV